MNLLTHRAFKLTIDRSIALGTLFSHLDRYPREARRVFDEHSKWHGDPYVTDIELSSFGGTSGPSTVFEALQEIRFARPRRRFLNTLELLILNSQRLQLGLKQTMISQSLVLGPCPRMVYEGPGRFDPCRVISLTSDFRNCLVAPDILFVTAVPTEIDLETFEETLEGL